MPSFPVHETCPPVPLVWETWAAFLGGSLLREPEAATAVMGAQPQRETFCPGCRKCQRRAGTQRPWPATDTALLTSRRAKVIRNSLRSQFLGAAAEAQGHSQEPSQRSAHFLTLAEGVGPGLGSPGEL